MKKQLANLLENLREVYGGIPKEVFNAKNMDVLLHSPSQKILFGWEDPNGQIRARRISDKWFENNSEKFSSPIRMFNEAEMETLQKKADDIHARKKVLDKVGLGAGLGAGGLGLAGGGYALGNMGNNQPQDLRSQMAVEIQSRYPEVPIEQALMEADNILSQM